MFYHLKILQKKTAHTGYNLPKVEIDNYNIMIDRRDFFDQRVTDDIRADENIQKIATGQGDEYKTG